MIFGPLGHNDTDDLPSDRQNERTELSSELTSTRFSLVARAFSGLGSSRPTSVASARLRLCQRALATTALFMLGAGAALAQGTNQGGRGGPGGGIGGGGFTGGGGGT